MRKTLKLFKGDKISKSSSFSKLKPSYIPSQSEPKADCDIIYNGKKCYIHICIVLITFGSPNPTVHVTLRKGSAPYNTRVVHMSYKPERFQAQKTANFADPNGLILLSMCFPYT